MYLGQEFHIAGDWFIIHFTENNGMAFGMEFAGAFGKLFLSLFRIAALTGIGWYLHHLVKHKSHPILISSIALIFAGALGNIIDSVFYGVIFDDSHQQLATLFSDKPYGTWLNGQVVDMFYFPFIRDYPMPEWVPYFGGRNFTFFNAIFNVADMAISTGVGILIVFNKKAFHKTY